MAAQPPGRAPGWLQRAAQHWREYFAAQVAEVTNRVHGRVSTLRQLVVIKCAYPIFDMAEVVHDFEVPPVVWHSPLLAEIRDRLAEVITATNDLVSADKEAEAGDHYNNLLLIAENRDGCTRPQAFERLQDLVHSRFAQVLDLEKQLGDTDALLTHPQRLDTRRYLDCLHDIVAGDNRWERTSGRYRWTRGGAWRIRHTPDQRARHRGNEKPMRKTRRRVDENQRESPVRGTT